MLRALAAHRGALAVKLSYEKSPTQWIFLATDSNRRRFSGADSPVCALLPGKVFGESALSKTQRADFYPKMSFTLSKIEVFRVAGRFSAGKVSPSCCKSARCARDIFVGVTTFTA